jgi:FdhD protein
MEGIVGYEAYKFKKGSVTKVTDPLTVESPLQININASPFSVVMQTPGAEKELVTGLLFAEDVIKNFQKVAWEFTKNENGLIDIVDISTAAENLAGGYKSARSLLSVSSCGICGKREIEELMPIAAKLNNQLSISFNDIFKLQQSLKLNQKIFKETGGLHGVALFDKELNLLIVSEDIGRHNALDKCVGSLILAQKNSEAKFMAFSGRISYEIVSKAFRAKIAFITAVSAPSSLAVDFAKEFGLTIVGFTRDNKATCYSNPSRISDLNQSH